MFGRNSSPCHLVCSERLSTTSTEKFTPKPRSSDHPWRKVWVKSGSVQRPQSHGPESGFCYEGWEEGPVSERTYPAGLEVLSPFALTQISHMCFKHILQLPSAACVRWTVFPYSVSPESCKGLSQSLIQVTLKSQLKANCIWDPYLVSVLGRSPHKKKTRGSCSPVLHRHG